MVECKVTRADFLQDRRKVVRRSPGLGAGQLRYYLTWPGLIRVSELPNGWGLLEVRRREVWRERKAVVQECDMRLEVATLLSALRRAPAGTGVSVRFYKWETGNRARVVVPGGGA